MMKPSKSKPQLMLAVLQQRGEVSVADVAVATKSHAKTAGKFLAKLVTNGTATVRLEKTKKLYSLVPGADPNAVKFRAAHGSVSGALHAALKLEKLTAREAANKIKAPINTVNVLLRRDLLRGVIKREKTFGHSRVYVYFID